MSIHEKSPGGVHAEPISGAEKETLIEVDNISVDASWGHIFGPVSLSVKKGGVTILQGAGGRGRTALLLTLAGRMKPSIGTVTAFGRTDDAHHLYDRAGIGLIDQVDAIGQTIRVHDVLTEQVRWTAPWYRWVPQSTEEQLEQLCRPVFGDFTLPSLDSMVEELPELTSALFRIAVANFRNPEVLVLGGIDQLASVSAAAKLLDRIISLGETQTVITADVNGVSDPRVRDVIEVPNLTDDGLVPLELEAIS